MGGSTPAQRHQAGGVDVIPACRAAELMAAGARAETPGKPYSVHVWPEVLDSSSW